MSDIEMQDYEKIIADAQAEEKAETERRQARTARVMAVVAARKEAEEKKRLAEKKRVEAAAEAAQAESSTAPARAAVRAKTRARDTSEELRALCLQCIALRLNSLPTAKPIGPSTFRNSTWLSAFILDVLVLNPTL